MTATLPRPSLPNPADFAHVREWVFDLDNTLYPHRINLFAQIDRNMTAFVANLLGMEPAEAKALQKRYYHDHGTTLKGLMLHHNADPSAFLEAAHAIDIPGFQPIPSLATSEGAAGAQVHPDEWHGGACRRHGSCAWHSRPFRRHFRHRRGRLRAKPAGETYDKFMAMHRIDTTRAAMFEDLPRNLLVPHALGMKTVLLVPEVFETGFVEAWEKAGEDDAHIGYMTHDLKGFLKPCLGARLRPRHSPTDDSAVR